MRTWSGTGVPFLFLNRLGAVFRVWASDSNCNVRCSRQHASVTVTDCQHCKQKNVRKRQCDVCFALPTRHLSKKGQFRRAKLMPSEKRFVMPARLVGNHRYVASRFWRYLFHRARKRQRQKLVSQLWHAGSGAFPLFLPGSYAVTDAKCTLTDTTTSAVKVEQVKGPGLLQTREGGMSGSCAGTDAKCKPTPATQSDEKHQLNKGLELLLRGGGGKQNQSKEQKLLVGLQSLLQAMDDDSEEESAESDGETKLLLQLKDLIKHHKKGSLLQELKSIITKATKPCKPTREVKINKGGETASKSSQSNTRWSNRTRRTNAWSKNQSSNQTWADVVTRNGHENSQTTGLT